MSDNDVPAMIARVAAAFDACGVEYFVGGSIASSLQGAARFTLDVDVVARLPAAKVDAFKASLGADFDVDEVALKNAMAAGRSWNIFVVATALRFDIFHVGPEAFDEEEMKRRRRVEIAPGVSVFVKSAEDTVLRKLLWFKAGAEANSQQLRDVVEVLRRQAGRLDESYLDTWATKLGIRSLLDRARSELK